MNSQPMRIEMRVKSRANGNGNLRETAKFTITNATGEDMKELALFFLRLHDEYKTTT